MERLHKETRNFMRNIRYKVWTSNNTSDEPPSYNTWDIVYDEDTCMHDSCPECRGTGIKRFGGFCVHNLSCNCKKCSPRCCV